MAPFSLTVALSVGLAAGAPAASLPLRQATVVPGVPQAGQDTTQIVALPAASVAGQAEVLADELRELRSRIALHPSISQIGEEFASLVKSLRLLRRDSDQDLQRPQPLRRLEEMTQQWARLGQQLDDWRQQLVDRSDALDRERDVLETTQTRWQLTRQAALDEAYPPALNERIQLVLRDVESAREQLSSRMDAVLTLQNQVSEDGVTVTEMLARIEEAQQAARQRLFTTDSPPLWQAVLSPQDAASLGAQLRRSWLESSESFAQFLDEYRQRVVLHLLMFLGLVALVQGLRVRSRRSRAWIVDEDAVAASAHILARPISSALLIALLATRWFYPGAPIVVSDLAFLALLIPVLHLVPGLVPAALRGPLYWLAGLFVVSQMGALATDQSLLRRLLVLVVTVSALGGLTWWVRPGGPASALSAGRWWSAARFFSRIGVLTLGASVLANVLGNVNLAELLTGATLNSALLANVLFAVAVVLTGLLTVLLRTRGARSLAAVRTHRDLLNSRIATTVRLTAVIGWAWSTLAMFRVFDPMLATVTAILAKQWSIGSLQISLGDLLAFAVTLWIAAQASRFIRFVLQEDVLPRIALARGVAGAVSMVVHYTVLGVGFVFAVAAAGIDLSRLALLIGAFGVGLGFGLQTVVNNFVSGLILLFERPIQVGDTIQVSELLGEVTRIGIRASTVRTFDGAEVIVPNGQLVSSEVVNWTLSDRLRRLEVDVGVAYGTDPKLVLAILLDAAKGRPGVLPDPEVQALFRGFGDSSLDFTLRFWTADFENFLSVKSQVTVAVNDAILEAGIEIPFPQRDLHVRSVASAVTESMAGKRQS